MKKLVLLGIIVFNLHAVYAQDKPNIIWLMAEDISIDLECYGMEAVKTPTLNKLAAEGVRFDHCYVTNSICSPSRSSMMVGVHQEKINAHHHRSNRNIPLNEEYKPFTYWLRQAGYTCILGNNNVMMKGRKIDVNFQHQALGEWDGISKFGLFDKYDTFEKADEPFFAQIQLVVTHRGDWWNNIREQSDHPVNPDSVQLPPYLADHSVIRMDWAKYLDQIEYMDNEIEMLIKDLKEKDLFDNTIIIFIGDNGRCNIKGKGYLFDPGLHIPLIIYYPKGLQGEKIRKDVVSAVDITATILDFAGIEIPDYMTGSPIFDNNFNRDEVYASRDLWDEIMEKSRTITTDKWKYIHNYMPEVPYDAHQMYLEFYRPAVHVMRQLHRENKLTDIEKQFFAYSKPAEELYNLENDPFETVNLAENAQYTSVLNDMRVKTLKYEKVNKASTADFEPTIISRELLNWVIVEKPELYQQMLEGVEIGFQTLSKEYKNLHK